MQLSNILDVSLLQEHINNRVITERPFRDTPLRILNYTQVAQFDNVWDNVTLQCRGLIYNKETGEIIARPFRKFWNFSDERFPETLPENLPAGIPVLAKKYDGSLGILFHWEGENYVATRGSFHSEQAEWATKWLQHNRPNLIIPPFHTPLVEILYPANRIVVDYGSQENLVLLAMVTNEDGVEIGLGQLLYYSQSSGLDMFEYSIRPVDSCLQENTQNEEGYVAMWLYDDKPPFRVKIKFEDYKRLHKLLTQCSQKTIWEMMGAGQSIETVLADTPAEFQQWARAIRDGLLDRFLKIQNDAMDLYDSAPKEPRKDFALHVTKHGNLAPVCFAILDGKRTDEIIWRQFKPSGLKVFKVDEES